MTAFADLTSTLESWLATLPLDGTDTAETVDLEARITELLGILDRGDEEDQRGAGLARTVVERVNQRRAGRRGES